jgi:hypothetical protein
VSSSYGNGRRRLPWLNHTCAGGADVSRPRYRRAGRGAGRHKPGACDLESEAEVAAPHRKADAMPSSRPASTGNPVQKPCAHTCRADGNPCAVRPLSTLVYPIKRPESNRGAPLFNTTTLCCAAGRKTRVRQVDRTYLNPYSRTGRAARRRLGQPVAALTVIRLASGRHPARMGPPATRCWSDGRFGT